MKTISRRRRQFFLVAAVLTIFWGIAFYNKWIWVHHLVSKADTIAANGSQSIHTFHQGTQNKTIAGKRFNCSYVAYLENLGLLSKKYVNLETEEMPKPMFVTAFSANHAEEAKQLLLYMHMNFPGQKIIVYDLGLSAFRNIFKKVCNVEIRTFNFSAFPAHVSRIHEFRWKPVIIAETLAEFGAIWYMDSSLVIKKKDLSHVYQLVQCRRNTTNRAPLPSSSVRDQLEETAVHESGWDLTQWSENVKQCRKSTYLLHGSAGHSIFTATHPDVYNYIPTNTDEIRKKKALMYEAGFIFAINTQETVENVLTWYVLCALEEPCMGPIGAMPGCDFVDGDRFSTYASCHRYDQSVVNLLVANAYWYDRHFYASEIVDFFNVVRTRPAKVAFESLHCSNAK